MAALTELIATMPTENSANQTEMNSTDETTAKKALGAPAYTAVGVLTEMQDNETYYTHDVDEAIEDLEAGVETPGVAETPAGQRVADAIENLEELKTAPPDAHGYLIQEALAELAPVAADVADYSPIDENSHGSRSASEKPTVPVFYNLPESAVDRAIERYNRKCESDSRPEQGVSLAAHIYDVIEEKHVFFVGGEPLGEYAGGRVEALAVEPDEA